MTGPDLILRDERIAAARRRARRRLAGHRRASQDGGPPGGPLTEFAGLALSYGERRPEAAH
jgi:hypothetical protein